MYISVEINHFCYTNNISHTTKEVEVLNKFHKQLIALQWSAIYGDINIYWIYLFIHKPLLRFPLPSSGTFNT